jgi:hypothetical protein
VIASTTWHFSSERTPPAVWLGSPNCAFKHSLKCDGFGSHGRIKFNKSLLLLPGLNEVVSRKLVFVKVRASQDAAS